MASTRGYQLVVFWAEETRVVDLPEEGEISIGRDETSGLRIDDPSVSRRHAILRTGSAATAIELEDLGGANGTFVRQGSQRAESNDTAQFSVRQVRARKAELTVGDCLLFGTAYVVLRRRPLLELPDLVIQKGEVPQGQSSGPLSAGAKGAAVVSAPAMQALYGEAAKVARSGIGVLLLGETGVGKEVLARAIHANSPRAQGPFLGVNCAALAESLLESELFGCEKGAFTGATSRAGIFEAAAGGTVFLDEVGELSLGTQAKLLRVLEERVVTRLGTTRSRPVDVRVVSATNRDVDADSRTGRMRPDLYYRLNSVTLAIPPLRARAEEIPALAMSFLEKACRDLDRTPPPAISSAAMVLLTRHLWPGNVRELRNVVERAAIMCAEDAILPEHLPAALRVGPPVSAPLAVGRAGDSSAGDLRAEMTAMERTRILEALERCQGNQSEAARILGLPRRTLVKRLSDLGLTRRRDVGPAPKG